MTTMSFTPAGPDSAGRFPAWFLDARTYSIGAIGVTRGMRFHASNAAIL